MSTPDFGPSSGSLLGRGLKSSQTKAQRGDEARGSVLPTLGNTELVEAQGASEGLLGEGLFRQYRSGSLRSFVTLWRIEQDELLDLS